MSELARVFDLPSLPPDERAELALSLAWLAFRNMADAFASGASLTPHQIYLINYCAAQLDEARAKVRRDAA